MIILFLATRLDLITNLNIFRFRLGFLPGYQYSKKRLNVAKKYIHVVDPLIILKYNKLILVLDFILLNFY